ncbi:Folylpolyglutamate synthase [Aphelenchoides fujianensis]|nr:Folylpolyglutamate synthase [Aphelenchoides fujianensis]
MADDVETRYKDAVAKLNGLQSNAKTIAEMRDKRQEMAALNMKETHFFLDALGIDNDKLDSLRAIHVSGTKGKGTTCAYVESILRHHGFRTGSPHLVHVRERIRIDGHAITKENFARRFFEVYEKVERAAKEHGMPMPAYFKFLTLMAFFHIHRGEGGRGSGRDTPWCAGSRTLDIDHTSLLGSTLKEIAWHKAGILKAGRPAFSVPQPPDVWEVFEKRAAERATSIRECVPFGDRRWSDDVQNYVEERGRHHEFNIALAVQLTAEWLRDQKRFDLTKEQAGGDSTAFSRVVERAILSTEWLGRNQVLKKENIAYFLDGAHTPKSIQFCAEWFKRAIEKPQQTAAPLRLLIFHCTADRDPMSLLPLLLDRVHFDRALFCPTRLLPVLDPRDDNTNLNQSQDEQWQKCLRTKAAWTSLTEKDTAETFACINDCVQRVHQLAENNAEIQVLVTGSLHLVGGVLHFEEPDTCGD